MEISPELQQKIDDAMASVTEKRLPNMKIHHFLHRLNQYIALTTKDKEKLVSTGYNWEKQEFLIALIAVLTQIHADRIAAEGKGARQIFGAAMKKIKMYSVILIQVTEHVIDRTGDKTIEAALKRIKKESNNLDTLHDILALASLLGAHLDIAKEFTPEGIEVNEGYLNLVTTEVEKLLTLEGKPDNETSERAMLVDTQEKLMTLCMVEIDEIKKYAKGAFCLHMDYYKKHYPLYLTQEGSINNSNEESDSADETIIESTEEAVLEEV